MKNKVWAFLLYENKLLNSDVVFQDLVYIDKLSN